MIITLIILSTILFVIGVLIEQQNEASFEGEENHDEDQEEFRGGESDKETVLGINLESPLVITIIVIVWIALITALVMWGHPVYIIISLVAVMAVIFDISEVIGKLGKNNLVAFLTGTVALSHIAIVILSGLAYFRK